MAEASFELESRLVLFLDFVGFSDFTKDAPPEQAADLLKMLVNIASLQAPYKFEVQQTSPDSTLTTVSPEITTFSDHIVASFPMKTPLAEQIIPVQHLLVLVNGALYIARKVTVWALELGLLVRGGLTVGDLYHRGAVVFGPGMIDAYELESRAAVYPRVAVSSDVYLDIPAGHYSIATDTDGIRYLNYFNDPNRAAVPNFAKLMNPPGEWAARMLGKIDLQIELLEAQRRWAEFAKWSWFRGKFIGGGYAPLDTDAPLPSSGM